jgi:hypothetical protein
MESQTVLIPCVTRSSYAIRLILLCLCLIWVILAAESHLMKLSMNSYRGSIEGS